MNGLESLKGAVADVLDVGGSLDVVTSRLAATVRDVIVGPGLKELFAGHDRSFTAYVDPARHFIVHCSVHHPGHRTEAHDHGETWAVYGVVAGASRYWRYSRGVDPSAGTAALDCIRDQVLEPGQVDVVVPGEVHLIGNETESLALNVVIRPRPIEQVWRRRFDISTGAYMVHPASLRGAPESDHHRDRGRSATP